MCMMCVCVSHSCIDSSIYLFTFMVCMLVHVHVCITSLCTLDSCLHRYECAHLLQVSPSPHLQFPLNPCHNHYQYLSITIPSIPSVPTPSDFNHQAAIPLSSPGRSSADRLPPRSAAAAPRGGRSAPRRRAAAAPCARPTAEATTEGNGRAGRLRPKMSETFWIYRS